MVSIVVMAHGQLSEALGVAVAQIVGQIEGMIYFSINPEVPLETIEQDLSDLILEASEGCIFLVDVLGGTPFILAGECLQEENVRVITGVNLPMLVALQAHRQMELHMLFDLLLKAGRDGIRGLKKSGESGGPLCLS